MPLNLAGTMTPRCNIPFQWSSEKITYLGLQIPNTGSKTFSLNYAPLLKKTEAELSRWMNLPLSLIGRINIIKMNVLPKFLFLFQMLPVTVPKFFFKQLNSAVTRFIWKGKIPRIKLKTLQGTPREGGLTLPNFESYYWAAQCRAVWVWRANLQHPPSWVLIEQQEISSMSLASVPSVPSFKQMCKLTTNPFIKHTYKLWSTLRKRTRSNQPLYNYTPFHANPLLPQALRDGITQIYFTKGIKTFGDLYEGGVLKSFEDLTNQYSLNKKQFFKFLQVKHYI